MDISEFRMDANDPNDERYAESNYYLRNQMNLEPIKNFPPAPMSPLPENSGRKNEEIHEFLNDDSTNKQYSPFQIFEKRRLDSIEPPETSSSNGLKKGEISTSVSVSSSDGNKNKLYNERNHSDSTPLLYKISENFMQSHDALYFKTGNGNNCDTSCKSNLATNEELTYADYDANCFDFNGDPEMGYDNRFEGESASLLSINPLQVESFVETGLPSKMWDEYNASYDRDFVDIAETCHNDSQIGKSRIATSNNDLIPPDVVLEQNEYSNSMSALNYSNDDFYEIFDIPNSTLQNISVSEGDFTLPLCAPDQASDGGEVAHFQEAQRNAKPISDQYRSNDREICSDSNAILLYDEFRGSISDLYSPEIFNQKLISCDKDLKEITANSGHSQCDRFDKYNSLSTSELIFKDAENTIMPPHITSDENQSFELINGTKPVRETTNSTYSDFEYALRSNSKNIFCLDSFSPDTNYNFASNMTDRMKYSNTAFRFQQEPRSSKSSDIKLNMNYPISTDSNIHSCSEGLQNVSLTNFLDEFEASKTGKDGTIKFSSNQAFENCNDSELCNLELNLNGEFLEVPIKKDYSSETTSYNSMWNLDAYCNKYDAYQTAAKQKNKIDTSFYNPAGQAHIKSYLDLENIMKNPYPEKEFSILAPNFNHSINISSINNVNFINCNFGQNARSELKDQLTDTVADVKNSTVPAHDCTPKSLWPPSNVARKDSTCFIPTQCLTSFKNSDEILSRKNDNSFISHDTEYLIQNIPKTQIKMDSLYSSNGLFTHQSRFEVDRCSEKHLIQQYCGSAYQLTAGSQNVDFHHLTPDGGGCCSVHIVKPVLNMKFLDIDQRVGATYPLYCAQKDESNIFKRDFLSDNYCLNNGNEFKTSFQTNYDINSDTAYNNFENNIISEDNNYLVNPFYTQMDSMDEDANVFNNKSNKSLYCTCADITSKNTVCEKFSEEDSSAFQCLQHRHSNKYKQLPECIKCLHPNQTSLLNCNSDIKVCSTHMASEASCTFPIKKPKFRKVLLKDTEALATSDTHQYLNISMKQNGTIRKTHTTTEDNADQLWSEQLSCSNDTANNKSYTSYPSHYCKKNKIEAFSKLPTLEKKSMAFACPSCRKEFKYKSLAIRHERTHTMERPFICITCQKGYSRSETLQKHMRSHETENGVDSSINTYIKYEKLQPKSVKSADADSRKANNSDLDSGGSIISEARQKCRHCDKTFKYRSKLEKHLTAHMAENSPNKNTSALPREINKELEMVRKTDANREKNRGDTKLNKYHHRCCCHCGKVFKSKSGLSAHICSHSGKKPFRSSDCGKSFKYVENLRKHAKRHSKENSLTCSTCGMHFKMPSLLHKHEKNHKITDRVRCFPTPQNTNDFQKHDARKNRYINIKVQRALKSL